MKLFRHENRERSHATRRVYALYELAYTAVDFGAAICFLVGSVLFFWPAAETPAVWLFTIGSGLFLAKPAIRLAREVKLLRMGRYEELAERVER
ncbi:YrhK family protein [Vannielia litorea]|uniref:YrhK family protein n=1 Tax=Vannielia TaxID=2813041 RepID=UPI001C96A630|nr:YrhK family protein [Vannielia litorea]MBY6046061.1 YrhK family protein [Vannielia litorea]MBY6073474.1 YrhK family protein [Vannielia litorea]MBY6154078.1 YrhK family protein [Vannielia litorea]